MTISTDALVPEPRPTPPSPSSRSPSSRHANRPSLTLDLTGTEYQPPTPPSNTLIITNLQSLDIFRPENLQTIRDLISKTAPIHSWSPLKSFRRIIVSFYNEDAAIAVRQAWNNKDIMGEQCRVYFGKETPVMAQEVQHLALPDSGKLFFISPPPSPPHGWEMKLEDAPNKMVHAEDLAEALAKLRRHNNPNADAAAPSPISPADSKADGSFASRQRSRSSTLIFQPDATSPHVPCVTVDDMTDEPESISPLPVSEPRRMVAHTCRPPVEDYMADA